MIPSDLPEESKKITVQVRRLKAGDPVRQMAERLLWQGSYPMEDVAPALEALTGRKNRGGRVREVAAWILDRSQLSPEQRRMCADTLCQFIQKDLQTVVRQAVLNCIFRALLVGSLFALSIVCTFVGPSIPRVNILTAIFFGLLALVLFTFIESAFLSPFILPISLALDYRRRSKRGSVVVRAIGGLRDPKSIGTLAAACKSVPLRKSAYAALHEVVPYLTVDYYARLESRVVPDLCDLAHNSDEALALDALEALGKIGDGRAVYTVERIASRGRTAAVRQAAAQILPLLQERQRAEYAPSVLLRAANRPGQETESLLRPTEQANETDPQQLLRAGTIDESSQQ